MSLVMTYLLELIIRLHAYNINIKVEVAGVVLVFSAGVAMLMFFADTACGRQVSFNEALSSRFTVTDSAGNHLDSLFAENGHGPAAHAPGNNNANTQIVKVIRKESGFVAWIGIE